jgi:hypothetical protein
MTVDQVFAAFVEKEGNHMLKDHMIQIWWYAQTEDEETLLRVIDTLSQQYEDPEAAEVGFIALWNHLSKA